MALEDFFGARQGILIPIRIVKLSTPQLLKKQRIGTPAYHSLAETHLYIPPS